MPEGLQNALDGETMQDAISVMETVIESLGEAQDALDEVTE
jgi:hypothetical protein